MKNLRLFLLLGIGLLIGSQSLSVWAKQKEKENEVTRKEQRIKELVESGRYTIDVNRVLPMSGSAVNLTSTYSLTLHGDSVISHLPYFGRAYTLPYGGGTGLRFESLTSNLSQTVEGENTVKVDFCTRSEDDSYTFDIKVFSNGSATIHVTPANKQAITYHGDLVVDGI
jgi:hypothetical protein